MADHIATAETEIEAPPQEVWTALTDPDEIEKYMFGSRVITDWKPGSPIVWKGEYDGKKYEDKGQILEVDRGRRLKMTHFSAMSGQEDVPENYHTLVDEVSQRKGKTHVALTQHETRPKRPRSTRGRTGKDALGP